MSKRFETTYDPNSEYRQYLEDRSKINVALWPDQMGMSANLPPSCKFCHAQYVTMDDQVTYLCPNCGFKTPIKEVKQEKKLVQRHGTTKSSGPIVISQKTPRRKKGGLEDTLGVTQWTEELRDELRGYGYRV